MGLDFVMSQKGKPLLSIDGYLFQYRSELASGERAWKCLHCPRRAYTDVEDRTLTRDAPERHGHPASPRASTLAKRLRHRIGAAATERTDLPPREILARTTGGIAPDVAAALPSLNSLRRSIQRKRQSNAKLCEWQYLGDVGDNIDVLSQTSTDKDNSSPRGDPTAMDIVGSLKIPKDFKDFNSDETYDTFSKEASGLPESVQLRLASEISKAIRREKIKYLSERDEDKSNLILLWIKNPSSP